MGVIALIMVIDFVFALDSIITAVGMTDVLMVMILANVIAILIMLASATSVSGFIARHPTVKMLALAFILLIGVALDRRRARHAYSARIYLLRHRLLAGGRNA